MFSTPYSSPSSSSPQACTIFDLLPNIFNLMPIRLDVDDLNNYCKWKYLMTTILKAYNLFLHVDGSLKCSEKFARYGSYSEAKIDLLNPKDQVKYREDQGVMVLINATLSSSALLDCVMECTSSRELWLQLDKSFEYWKNDIPFSDGD